MDDIKLLAQAYRLFLIELGQEFERIKTEKAYEGFAETFIDAIKSPEIGFTVSEVDSLIKISNLFWGADREDLPSHNIMKLMATKNISLDMLNSAKTLSLSDFKELVKDSETGTQNRTYKYEIVKRCIETNNISRVYGDELQEALKTINNA